MDTELAEVVDIHTPILSQIRQFRLPSDTVKYIYTGTRSSSLNIENMYTCNYLCKVLTI